MKSTPQTLHATFVELWHKYALDWGLVLVVVALGLLMRLPRLQTIPYFDDEALEVIVGLNILLKHQFPLTNYDPYYGPYYPYLIALLFRIFGLSPLLPRLTIAVFGAFTVGLTYWLGKSMFNRPAGILAALLTASCSYLIIFSSHWAWSNSLTPFITTLTVLIFYFGVTRKKWWLYGLGGFSAALMIQSHPLAVFAVGGIALWVGWKSLRAGGLGWQPLVLAGVCLLIGYSPVIIANAQPDPNALRQAYQRPYAFAPTFVPSVYLNRLGTMLLRVGMMVAAVLARFPVLAAVTPLMVIYDVLLLGGIAYAIRTRRGLLVSVFATTVFLMPIILTGYNLLLVRYFDYLAPLGFVAIGGVVVAVVKRVFARLPVRDIAEDAIGPALIVSLIGVVLAVPPLVNMDQYYQKLPVTRTNVPFLRFVDIIYAHDACDNGLWIEDTQHVKAKTGDTSASFLLATLDYTLTLSHCQHTFTEGTSILTQLHARGDDGWVVISQTDEAAYAKHVALQPIAQVKPVDTSPTVFILCHVAPLSQYAGATQ